MKVDKMSLPSNEATEQKNVSIDPRDAELQALREQMSRMEEMFRFASNQNKLKEYERANQEVGNMRVHIPLFPDRNDVLRVVVDYSMKKNHVYQGYKGISSVQTITVSFLDDNGEKVTEEVDLDMWNQNLKRSQKIAVDWAKHMDGTEFTEKEVKLERAGHTSTEVNKIPTKRFQFAVTYEGRQYILPDYLANI